MAYTKPLYMDVYYFTLNDYLYIFTLKPNTKKRICLLCKKSPDDQLKNLTGILNTQW